jgi:hypothetical protein
MVDLHSGLGYSPDSPTRRNMRQERVVFGAGPIPGLPGQLFVLFVEPSKPEADTFYADDISSGLIEVQKAYPDDRLILLPPIGTPPDDARVPDDTADTVVADLAELVDARTYRGITEPGLIRRLCRAGLEFVVSCAWETHGLLVAKLAGAPYAEAEVVVAKPTEEGPGFTLYPGRGAFARMTRSKPGSFPIEDVLAVRMNVLPDWAAPSARSVYGEAVVPEPFVVLGGARGPVGDHEAAVLGAITAAIASSGTGHAGNVHAMIRRWVP